jgi:hypothetical protein
VQTSKVVALFYATISLIHSVVGIFIVIFGPGAIKGSGLVCIFLPIIMGVLSFPVVLLCGWVYNLLAKRVGGVEFTVEDVDPALRPPVN